MIPRSSIRHPRIFFSLLTLCLMMFSLHSQASARGRRKSHPGVTRPTAAKPIPQKSYRQRLEEAVATEAERYHIDPLLIWALLAQESGGGHQFAKSPKGASGPMQLMPGTAVRWGVKDPTDPEQAVRGGTEYLVWLIDRFDGDVRLGLAGYNAGEGAIDRYGRRIPPYRETQDYVRLIEQRYLKLCQDRRARGGVPQAAASAKPVSPTVTETYSFRFRVSAGTPPATAPVAAPSASLVQSGQILR